MQIDWLTVGAQIANFLILVALLKRFLYRPVLDAMARREARIAEQLHEAERRETEAEARSREYLEKSRDLDARREEILSQARDEADADRRHRVQEAQAEVQRQREHWSAELRQDWEDVRKTIARRLAGAVTDTARQVLAHLADTPLEQAMSRAFSRRLASLDATERSAIPDGGTPMEIATDFEPDAETRAILTEAVERTLGRPIRFVRDGATLGGIELRTTGWKLSWTVGEYLRGIDEELAEAIATATRHTEPRP